MAISRDIVSAWRDQNPPGRFLIKDELNTGLWNDVGDQKAREKISQALREKGPEFRRHHGMRQNDMDDPYAAKPNTPRPEVVSKQHSFILYFIYLATYIDLSPKNILTRNTSEKDSPRRFEPGHR
jgi:hypothetical protein